MSANAGESIAKKFSSYYVVLLISIQIMDQFLDYSFEFSFVIVVVVAFGSIFPSILNASSSQHKPIPMMYSLVDNEIRRNNQY